MAKRIDPAAAWAAYEAGHGVLRRWLDDVPPSAWRAPSVLPGWDVADLVAHLWAVADSVTAVSPAPTGVVANTLSDYLASYAPAAASISDKTQRVADDAGREPAKILAAVDDRFAAAASAMESVGWRDVVVNTRRVPARLGDYLLTRVIEIAVHADDLACSVAAVADLAAPTLPRDTERLAVRALLDVLAERAPGRTVEVRVPPHAAVQCVEGPRHSRGTPPNVVELPPAAWLRLAAGRTTWADALAAGAVHASGARADLSALLPLL